MYKKLRKREPKSVLHLLVGSVSFCSKKGKSGMFSFKVFWEFGPIMPPIFASANIPKALFLTFLTSFNIFFFIYRLLKPWYHLKACFWTNCPYKHWRHFSDHYLVVKSNRRCINLAKHLFQIRVLHTVYWINMQFKTCFELSHSLGCLWASWTSLDPVCWATTKNFESGRICMVEFAKSYHLPNPTKKKKKSCFLVKAMWWFLPSWVEIQPVLATSSLQELFIEFGWKYHDPFSI